MSLQASDVLASLKEKSQRLPALSELFHVGQLVRGVILSLDNQPKASATNSKSGKKTINISLTVSKLNAALLAEAIQSGSPTTGCVTSIEDHGYTITFGKGLKGFLSKQSRPKGQGEGSGKGSGQGPGLKAGMLVECVAVGSKGKQAKALKVTAAPNVIAEAVTNDYEGLSIGESTLRNERHLCIINMTQPVPSVMHSSDYCLSSR